MISRQNIIAVFMALLLTIFLLGCTNKQAEKQEAPAAVLETAPEALPESAQEAASEEAPADIDVPEANAVVGGEGEEPLPGEPPSEEDVTLEEPVPAEGTY